MVSKVKADKIVKDRLDDLKILLNISKSKINVYVYHSKSKELKEKGVKQGGEMGCCYSSGLCDNHDIVLYYNKCRNEREFLSTLIHELLHVKVGKISNYVTIGMDKVGEIEEKIVRDLESVIIGLLWPED